MSKQNSKKMPEIIYAVKIKDDDGEDVMITNECLKCGFEDWMDGEIVGVYELKEYKKLSIDKKVTLI